MRSVLVILLKDVRRFWWETAISLALLTVLTWLDVQRYDFVPGPMEGLLRALLPVAWAYLVAMVIQEDGLVGGREFWMVRPISRASLAIAKVLFIVVAVHVPDFVADCIVVASHGHSLAGSVLALLLKQAVLAALVTIPAAALASVTENLAQFLPVALAYGVGVYLLASSKLRDSLPWDIPDTRNRFAGLMVLLVCAATVLVIQFRFRRTGLARWIGAASIVSGGLLFATATSMIDGFQCAPADSSVVIESVPGKTAASEPRGRSPARGIQIPVRIKGLPENAHYRTTQMMLQVKSAGGRVWNLASRPDWTGLSPDTFLGQLSLASDIDPTQFLLLGVQPYQELSAGPFTVRGQARLTFLDEQDQTLQADNGLVTMQELGRCSAQLSEPWLFRVYCESPDQVPRGTVILASQKRKWRQRLGDSMPALGYPWQTWLSPLFRRQTFFQLAEGSGTSDNWLAPRDSAKAVTIRTEKPTGCRVVSYELPDIRIGQ